MKCLGVFGRLPDEIFYRADFAVEQLVKKAGGIVVGCAAVLAEGDAADRTDITYLEKLPLFFS